MVKWCTYLLVAVMLMISTTSFAAPKADPKEAQKQQDLLETQKRLNALIKAAIANDVINKEEKKPESNPVVKPHSEPKAAVRSSSHDKKEPHLDGKCVAKEIFEFPHDVHMADYQSLVMLKNSILIGPNEVDKHKVRLLVLAYIGLGFGEEARDYSTYLSGAEARVLTAMAHAVSGDVSAQDVKALSAQEKCSGSVALWVGFAKIQVAQNAKPKHDENSDAEGSFKLSSNQLEQIQTLPSKLGAIMAKRFGVHAVKHDAMNTATDLLKFLQKAQKKSAVKGMFDDEEKYFEAVYYLKQDDKRAFPTLNALAKKDGPLQVKALQTLGVVQTKTGALAYPGFEEDLNGAAHVFSQHPEGRQALVEKINLFVATDRIDQAIGMTKEKFLPHEAYYTDSVLRVSERMQVYLTGDDLKQKLYALNTLLREQIFFDALENGFPLRRDGVGASLDLGLSELAPRILPVEQWGRLELHILQDLALALPEDMKRHLPKKAFSGAKYEAQAIQVAFDKRQPKTAMKALRGMGASEDALAVAAHASLKNGYWSLARKTNEDLNALRGRKNGEENTAQSAKAKLVSVLSVPSPFLASAAKTKNIGDYTALQTFLDNDIEIIKDYVNNE